jgi:hypothetical protein
MLAAGFQIHLTGPLQVTFPIAKTAIIAIIEEPGSLLAWSAVICKFTRYGATSWIGDGAIPYCQNCHNCHN